MILTTRHTPDFDITKEVTDPSKSHILDDYFDNDRIFACAYKWLFNLIGHDKFIWCYVASSHLVRSHGEEYMEWTLDVPQSECIFIREDIWHLVLSKMPYFKEMNDDIPDKEWDRLTKLYEPIKEKTWEENIFTTDPTDVNNIQVLVKSPILEKYVVDKKWICEICDDDLEGGIVNRGFSTQEAANHYFEIMKSKLNGLKIPFTYQFSQYTPGFGLKMEWSKDK